MPAGSAEWPEADVRQWQDAINSSLLKYQQAVNMAAKGWMPLGATDPTPGWLRPTIDLEVDRIAADIKRASGRYSIKQPVAWDGYSMPSRWLLGTDQPPSTVKTFSFINNRSDSERSKPVGLTKKHVYTDKEGDTITTSFASPGHATACLEVQDVDTAIAYVSKADSVPLALNVLGYDRPGNLHSSFVAEVGNYTAGRAIPNAKYNRDALLADAIASLQAVDAYDQREAKRQAEEEAAAKRAAEYAKHKQESFDRAKQAYADAIRDQIASGIDAESAAKVQAALSAYETARRKLEGLPS